MPKITKSTIDDLKKRERRTAPFIVFDDALPGFGVRVLPSGVMSYIFEYRPNPGGRGTPKSRMTIGKEGTLTPQQARNIAEDHSATVKKGGDPAKELAEKRAAKTMADLIDAFEKDHVAAKLKKRTGETYGGSLARLKKELGSRKAETVTREKIEAIHLAMRETPFAANHLLAVATKLFNWASLRKHVPENFNPARHIERYKTQGRERFLTAEELTRLGDVLRLAETDGLPWVDDPAKPKSKHLPRPQNRRTRIDTHAIAAIRLLIFTGARLREILHAEWSQLDMQRGVLFLPDSKTGRKPVYLSAAALAVIADIPRIDGNPHIIAGMNQGAKADLKKPWERITNAAGLSGLRIHDLRHSFASVGAGASLGLPIIGKLLGQKQAATTQRYSHLHTDPLHRAVNTIGAEIAAALDGNKGAEIIELRTNGKRP